MISIHLLETTQAGIAAYRVMLGPHNQEIGLVRKLAEVEGWRMLPGDNLPDPGRKIVVNNFRSKEAAAAALACYYYEGERRAIDGDNDSDGV